MTGHNNYFYTVPNSTNYQQKNSKPTTTLYPSADYPIGLTYVNFSYEKDIRIKSHFNHVKFNEINKAFDSTIHLDAWGDSIMCGAGCTWFDNFKHDRDFQHGKLTLKPDELKKGVSFLTEFSSQPAVIVWLSGFDVSAFYDWRFSVETSHITTIGFQIVGECLGNTRLNSMEATWIAYPASRPNIDSGWFDTTHVNWQTVEFRKTFESVPKVFFALSKIDSEHGGGQNLNVQVNIGTTTTKSTNLIFDTNTFNMYSGAGQWIAVQDY